MLTLAAVAVVACGGGSTTNSGGGSGGSYGYNQSANQNASGTPTQGGILQVVGTSDIDHLDTASAYTTYSSDLLRTFTRQLFAYPASEDVNTATTPVPDLATVVPTKTNGGISADGKTYTIHLKPNVDWDTTPARPVTADDVLLGFKRLCNPTENTVGAPQYYEGVIDGMTQYCNGFTNVAQTIPAFKTYMTGNNISGIKVINPATVQFSLMAPAADFVNILAMGFSSPAPVEYLNYMPDDANFRQNTISDGPYKITKYVPTQSITLARNTAWKQSTDTIRHQYLDGIQVTEGVDPNAVQQQIQAGTSDVEWDSVVPTPDVPSLKATNNPQMGIYPGFTSNPFLVFNEQSPNNGGALGNVKVRQALEYAVDKVAIGQIYGGPELNTPLDQALAPGNEGYIKYDPYPTPGDKGDPAKCKSLLAAAGYPKGLTITDLYRTSSVHPQVYESIQADFAKCGVTVVGKPVAQGDYYGQYLGNPSIATGGVWDISEPGWVADWYGLNARANLEPLFDGRLYGPGTTDWGHFVNKQFDTDIDNALATTDHQTQVNDLHDADEVIMQQAAIIPFETQSVPLMRSTRVHNAIYMPTTEEFDYSNIWLSPSS
ncbi:MAG TPA: ABC transporter substrate-binding protein [Pseudonocardiaceae bacterium]|nr:ABC transporter substrate-binding protein [Pseudonocardiaceae bacterium]